MEIAPEPLHEGVGEVGVVMVVDAANDLLGVPGGADVAPGIAGGQQPDQLGGAVVLEAFIGSGEQPPGSIQGIVLVAPMLDMQVI